MTPGMLQDHLGWITAQIKAGVPLETITASMMSRAEAGLLQRCALPRYFDRQLVDEVLRAGVPGGESTVLPFQELVKNEAIERVPRTAGVYRVRPRHRARTPGEASAIPALDVTEVARLNHLLAEHFARRGPEWQLERLYHLLAIDPERARALFEDLYREADERFDLPRCHDLIGLLDEQLHILGPGLAERLNDRRLYLATRSHWSEEYYQSARYYERPEVRRAFETVLEDPTRWILHFYADGGMGKTMFIRRMIAYRCVPEPVRIPCARVDFDFEDPARATQAPWQFLARLAEQLNVQIPGAPFREIIDAVNNYLRSRGVDPERPGARARVPPVADPHGEKLAWEIPERFAAALNEARPAGPVVIVFDTLEEPLLRQQTDLMGIFELIGGLHGQCSGVRMLLSGRYDLAARLPAFRERFGGEMVDLNVPRLTPDEARTFLCTTRGLETDPRLPVVIERADGLPFKLRLFADILEGDPELTADHIRAYPNVDLLYLIGRIIGRLRDGRLQWLVRYGVVPRRLTFAFLTDIMARYLPPAMSGKADYDDPTRGLPPRPGKAEVFPRNLPEEVDYRALWASLMEYASGHSWVQAAAGEPDTLVFHADVVNPMRRLLEDQPVYPRLHEAAVEYFERKAEADPLQRARWLREAVYHKFQVDGPEAGAYWRGLVDRAAGADGMRERHELAAEVRGPEYLDDEGQPRTRKDGRPMIAPETLLEAHYVFARTGVALARARSSSDETDWQGIRGALSAAEALREGVSRPAVSEAEVALVEAALMVQAGRFHEALETIESGVGQASGTVELELAVERAEVLAALGRREARAAYDRALTLCRRVSPSNAALLIKLLRGLAREQQRAGALKKAIAAGGEALARARRQVPDLVIGLVEMQQTLYRENGAPGLALKAVRDAGRRLQRSPTPDPAASMALVLAEASARFGLADPLGALELGRKVLGEIERSAGAAGSAPLRLHEIKADALELAADALTALCDHREALESLDAARALRRELGSPDAVNRCFRRSLRIHLRDLGDLRAAGEMLQDSGTAGVVEIDLLRAEWLDRSGEGDAAREVVDDLLMRRSQWSATTVVGIVLEGLARRGSPTPSPYLEALVGALGRLESHTMRLRLLSELWRCPGLPGHSASIKRHAGSLLAIARAGIRNAKDLPPSDRALLLLRAAEVWRVVGNHAGARGLLERAVATLPARERSGFVLREVLQAFDRLEPPYGPRLVARQWKEAFARRHERHPVLCAVFDLEEAERLWKLGDRAHAKAHLARAMPALGQEALFASVWSARLHELRSRVAAFEGRTEEAGYRLRVAQDAYAKLGDTRAKLEVAPERPGDVESAEKGTVVVQLRPAAGGLEVRAAALGHAGRWRRTGMTGSAFKPFWEGFRESLRTMSPYAWLGVMFGDPGAMCLEMGRLVLSRNVSEIHAGLEPGDPFDLRLEFGRGLRPCEALPWELMRTETSPSATVSGGGPVRYLYRSGSQELSSIDRLRWLQRSLNTLLGTKLHVDGIAGKETWAAVREFQRRVGLGSDGLAGPKTRAAIDRALLSAHTTRPSVLILRPSLERERQAIRGGRQQGLHVDDTYRGAGLEVAVNELASPGEVNRLPSPAPTILHLCATLKEDSVEHDVYLDFAGDWRGSSDATRLPTAGLFGPPWLDRLISSAPEPRPLVILDIDCPATPTETMLQLLYRNLFAAELFAFGNVPAVLATGLGSSAQRGAIYRVLASHVAERAMLGDVRERVARAVSEPSANAATPKDWMATGAPAAVALFAHDPLDRPRGLGEP